jgi:hypothetical protein
LCDELCSFDVWDADGVCCSGLDVQIAPRRLGEFLKRGQWFSKSSRDGYEKLWCSGNALPLYRLSQPKEIRTTGNHFSSFGHTWFRKKINRLMDTIYLIVGSKNQLFFTSRNLKWSKSLFTTLQDGILYNIHARIVRLTGRFL